MKDQRLSKISRVNDVCLAKLNRINQQLAECITIEDAKRGVDAAALLEIYAKRVGANVTTFNRAAALKVRFERRLGELLSSAPKARGTRGQLRGRKSSGDSVVESPENKSATLKELGITPKLSMRSQRVAAVPVEKFDALLSQIEAEADKEMGTTKIVSGLLSNVPATKFTGDTEWFTPSEYVEAARRVLGDIDLDPASNDQAQQVIKAEKYFTPETDGLTHKWNGRVFLNPPYGQPEVAQFIKKLLDEINCGRVIAAILLTNDNTDTDWFQASAQKAAAVCFVHTRIKFWKPDGRPSSPTNGQSFFYFGEALSKFVTEFEPFGILMKCLQ